MDSARARSRGTAVLAVAYCVTGCADVGDRAVARFRSLGKKRQEPLWRAAASQCTYVVHCIWLAGVLSISAEGRAQSLMGEVQLLQGDVRNAGSDYIVNVTPISRELVDLRHFICGVDRKRYRQTLGYLERIREEREMLLVLRRMLTEKVVLSARTDQSGKYWLGEIPKHQYLIWGKPRDADSLLFQVLANVILPLDPPTRSLLDHRSHHVLSEICLKLPAKRP